MFEASSEPDSEPASEASSRRSAEAVGNATPRTIVTGSTTRIALPNSARSVSIGLAGSSASGRPRTPTRPISASAATRIWVTASSRSGSRRRGRMTLNTIAPIAMPARKIARITVNTYVVLPVPDARRRVQVTW